MARKPKSAIDKMDGPKDVEMSAGSGSALGRQQKAAMTAKMGKKKL